MTAKTDFVGQAASSGESRLAGYTPDRPLLLISDFPPDGGGGGGAILRSLLGPHERARIVWACLTAPREPQTGGWGGVVPLRSASAVRGRPSLVADSVVRASAIAREALDLARQYRARAIWVVMHGASVHVAAHLSRAAVLPLHLTVHDDPAGIALRTERYAALLPIITRDFSTALRGASSIDVVSPGMLERYRRQYGIEAVIVHRAVDGPVSAAPPFDRAREGLHVGVFGSTYGERPLKILAGAVAHAAAALGVPGRLSIIGQGQDAHGGLRRRFAGRAELVVTGYVDEEDAVARLRRCLLLYVNYPFGRRDRIFRQTSFPTKLTNYVAAARPLLVHAPVDSSLSALVGAFPRYGYAWRTNRSVDGEDTLVRLWNEPGLEQSMHVDAEMVRQRYFDPPTNSRSLFGALNALVPDHVR